MTARLSSVCFELWRNQWTRILSSRRYDGDFDDVSVMCCQLAWTRVHYVLLGVTLVKRAECACDDRVSMSEGEVFHEKQRLELCAIHALNNVLQERVFTKETADDICKRWAFHTHTHTHRERVHQIWYMNLTDLSSTIYNPVLYLGLEQHERESKGWHA